MTEAPDTPDDSFLNDFLAAYLNDVEGERRRSLADYQAMFAGHEAAVAAEYEHLHRPADFDPDVTRDLRHAPLVPGVELTAEIGRGGQGVVYQGRQQYLDRVVAIKLLDATNFDESFGARFRREAKLLATMRHPNIVACHDAGVTEAGTGYMVMEFVEGPNLREWLHEHGPMTEDAALRMLIDLARALQHGLESDVIHRDVKPENILMQPTSPADGHALPFEVKLADLGLARAAHAATDDDTSTNLTATGTVMGSPTTMAPEQFEHPESVDFRADIFALGCVLFHALTGEPAFRQKSFLAALAERAKGPLEPLRTLRPGVRPAVGELVDAMLASDRHSRPQSYQELIERCTAIVEPPRRSPRWLLAAALCIAALVVVVVVDPWSGPAPLSITARATRDVKEGQRVEMTASVDRGPGAAASFAWTQTGGAEVDLETPDAARTAFVAPRGLGDARLAFEVEAVGPDGTRRGTRSLEVLVQADPSLSALSSGQAMPLLASGELREVVRDWWPTEDAGTWGGQEEPLGATALCADGKTYRSRRLPRGHWVLSGAIAPLLLRTKDGRQKVGLAGVELAFFRGRPLRIELRPDAEAETYRARLALRDDEGDGYAPFGPQVHGAWGEGHPLHFVIRWNGTRLEVGIGNPEAGRDWREIPVEAQRWGSGHPPHRLTLMVERGYACFSGLQLRGL